MLRLVAVVIRSFASLVRSGRELLLENLALRQQLATIVQKGRSRIRTTDRVFWVALQRVWSRRAEVLVVVKPETVVAWNRAGYRLYWQRLSRRGKSSGRPAVAGEMQDLIRRMATENHRRAPRIHGEPRRSAARDRCEAPVRPLARCLEPHLQARARGPRAARVPSRRRRPCAAPGPRRGGRALFVEPRVAVAIEAAARRAPSEGLRDRRPRLRRLRRPAWGMTLRRIADA